MALLRLGTGGSCSGDASVDSIGTARCTEWQIRCTIHRPRWEVLQILDSISIRRIRNQLTSEQAMKNTMDLAPTDTEQYTNGCDSLEFTGTGADVSFYKYPYGDMSYIKDPSFYSSTYKSLFLDSITGVKAQLRLRTHCWIP
ncbi:hypothetical protein JCM33374_g6171 [Metschnikowia sp. JCM 33374]|nr:hypothetical protein JCM33374_g6171 [Metschnikowia sp. JCM 33374]